MNARKFLYDFSPSEVLALASFFSERQGELPPELFSFSRALQERLYGIISIEEAEKICKK